MGAIARAGARSLVSDDFDLAPGRVAIGTVRALREGKLGGKRRPVVLVSHRSTSSWAVMGLTSKSTYGTGVPRIALRDWQAAGLLGPCFLWGGRLAILPLDDIHKPCGWISYADALEIRRFAGAAEGPKLLAAVAARDLELDR